MWLVKGFGQPQSHFYLLCMCLFEARLSLSGWFAKSCVPRPVPGGLDSTSSSCWSESSPVPGTELSDCTHDLMQSHSCPVHWYCQPRSAGEEPEALRLSPLSRISQLALKPDLSDPHTSALICCVVGQRDLGSAPWGPASLCSPLQAWDSQMYRGELLGSEKSST